MILSSLPFGLAMGFVHYWNLDFSTEHFNLIRFLSDITIGIFAGMLLVYWQVRNWEKRYHQANDLNLLNPDSNEGTGTNATGRSA